MVDFVPNHTARDSPWISEASNLGDLYVVGEGDMGPAFGTDPYSGDWTDTAQLNYWSEPCREHMIRQLLSVASVCDGVRVDMAMLCCNPVFDRTWGSKLRSTGAVVPATEFWPVAFQRIRQQYPDFFFMAECYEYEQIYPNGTGRELLRQGFDAVYDKVTYDRLSEGHMDRLRDHLLHCEELPRGHLCHFTENHDEPRAFSHFGEERAAAATVVSLTLPGPRLLMWQQEAACRTRLAVHLRRARRGPAPGKEEASFFQRLITDVPAKCQGTWIAPCNLTGNDSWRLLAWSWTLASGPARSITVVVVNYTDAQAWGNVDTAAFFLSETGATLEGSITLMDILSQEAFERPVAELANPEQGLVVGLGAYQSHVFSFELPL
eukprot:TRINITY_DN31195_c0_g1_i2.p1 TRINITY_DN31195_c0_g1~~TRINITY_DN31195_c0_g1_i2.p1  ORF type:complete len:378 (+),score=29.11 TRINITY_DN31195_c0_g1_i2:159-1292(+)